MKKIYVCDLCGNKDDHLHHFIRVKVCCKCQFRGANYKGPRIRRDFHTDEQVELMKERGVM
jgi:hypothetical protein